MRTPADYLAATATPEAALLLALADARAQKYQLLLARAIRNAAPKPQ